MRKQSRCLVWKALTATLLLFCFVTYAAIAQTIPRISVHEAHDRVVNGQALLVCSYSDGYCKDLMLKGAILKSELESKAKTLPKDSELIFYCA